MAELSGFDINRLFGKNLKRLRARKGISQMTLANLADLTHNFINEIENGRKWVSTDTLAKLTTALEAEPYEFFLAKNNKKDVDSLYFEDHLGELTDSFNKMVHDFLDYYLDEAGDTDDDDEGE